MVKQGSAAGPRPLSSLLLEPQILHLPLHRLPDALFLNHGYQLEAGRLVTNRGVQTPLVPEKVWRESFRNRWGLDLSLVLRCARGGGCEFAEVLKFDLFKVVCDFLLIFLLLLLSLQIFNQGFALLHLAHDGERLLHQTLLLVSHALGISALLFPSKV